MKIQPPPRHRACPPKLEPRRAFTLIEALAVVAALALVVSLFIPAMGHEAIDARHRRCANNLKQTGVAFDIWAGDHRDQYPMEVPLAQGGVQELIATGNVAACFQVMSNLLGEPEIAYCPFDLSHRAATNWAVNFSRTNVSYFIGLHATVDLNHTNPDAPTVLAGDADLLQNGHPVTPGLLDLRTNTFTWTHERHGCLGRLLLPDGCVQTADRIGSPALEGTLLATNTLVIP